MAQRGKYIVIEGNDGTGKSTQAIRITEKLKELGKNPLVVHNPETGNNEPVQEPGGTPKADILRKKIKDKTIERTPWQNVEWFTEARESIWHEAIEPALAEGRWVVTARSWLSTVAYQGYGEGIDIEKIASYTKKHVGEAYMKPDYVCILAVMDEAERKLRLGSRDDKHLMDTFESKPAEFQTALQDGYRIYADEHGIDVIDASPSRDEVFETIWQQGIEPLLQAEEDTQALENARDTDSQNLGEVELSE